MVDNVIDLTKESNGMSSVAERKRKQSSDISFFPSSFHKYMGTLDKHRLLLLYVSRFFFSSIVN